MSYKISTRKLRGKIIEDENGYQKVKVTSPKDTPAYLRIHYLSGGQRAQNAQVGDKVKLQYISTHRFGLWCAEKI